MVLGNKLFELKTWSTRNQLWRHAIHIHLAHIRNTLQLRIALRMQLGYSSADYTHSAHRIAGSLCLVSLVECTEYCEKFCLIHAFIILKRLPHKCLWAWARNELRKLVPKKILQYLSAAEHCGTLISSRGDTQTSSDHNRSIGHSDTKATQKNCSYELT